MDILWAAVGISLIVGFVFYILAGHFGTVLRKQASTIRTLADRVQLLEEVENPQFRQRIGDAAPPPLEQVFLFSFRLGDEFWRQTLRLNEEDWKYVRECGSFVGSVKLERWRSHTTAIVTEVLPNRKAAAWQTRSLEFYPTTGTATDALTIWELPLGSPTSEAKPCMLRLLLDASGLTLATDRPDDALFFRTPLELGELSFFRTEGQFPTANGDSPVRAENQASKAIPWQTFYSWEDKGRGIEWQLQVRDLRRKAEWERWKILESPRFPLLKNRA
jgi:hypothetical protein